MSAVEEIISYLLGARQPWWVYGLLALIPICMLITVREMSCWFWKINKLVDRLERIEVQLRNLRLGNEAPQAARAEMRHETSGVSKSVDAVGSTAATAEPHRSGPDSLGPTRVTKGPTEL